VPCVKKKFTSVKTLKFKNARTLKKFLETLYIIISGGF